MTRKVNIGVTPENDTDEEQSLIWFIHEKNVLKFHVPKEFYSGDTLAGTAHMKAGPKECLRHNSL